MAGRPALPLPRSRCNGTASVTGPPTSPSPTTPAPDVMPLVVPVDGHDRPPAGRTRRGRSGQRRKRRSAETTPEYAHCDHRDQQERGCGGRRTPIVRLPAGRLHYDVPANEGGPESGQGEQHEAPFPCCAEHDRADVDHGGYAEYGPVEPVA